jgi:polar amino acid transport system permease protein
MDYLAQLLSALPTTLGLTIFGALGALVVSFAAGLLRMSQNRLIRGITRVYVEVFRGTSLLVQLFFMSVALTQLSGYRLYQWTAALLTFALSYGAYGSEVVRGSIEAVPKAQWEATTALSLSPADRMRRVILPQAVPLMVPAFGNLLIERMKGTALVSLIAMTDVFKVAQDLRAGDAAATLGIFAMVLLIYFVLGLLLSRGVQLYERRALANIGRPQPPLLKVRWLSSRTAGAGGGA